MSEGQDKEKEKEIGSKRIRVREETAAGTL